MNRHDVPAGHKVTRFGSRADGPWLAGAVGDVVLERGPRIGTRLWLIVDLEVHRRWTHAVLAPVDVPAFTQAVIDGGEQWNVGPETRA